MKFIVTTDFSTMPQSIEFNADELRAELEEKLQHYNTLVVTPDTIDEAVRDRTALRKWREAVEERRKEIKRQCLAPYEAFEQKYKELLVLIDAPIASIDGQIKAFEEQEKQKKYARLKQYFLNCTASVDIGIDVNFETILNPKWANKGMKPDSLEQEIWDSIRRIQEDVREIRQLYADSPHLTAVMHRYIDRYSKGDALAYAAMLVQQENARRADQKPVQANAETMAHIPAQMQETPAEGQEKQIAGTFRVIGTKSQMIALRNFMKQSGIKFETIKQEENYYGSRKHIKSEKEKNPDHYIQGRERRCDTQSGAGQGLPGQR